MCCSYVVVWDVEGGRGLPVRRHSCGGYRVELWRASDRLKNEQKQLKVKQSRLSRGLYLAKNRYNALWTNGRARGVRFLLGFRMYLFLAPNGPGVPVFDRCPKKYHSVPICKDRLDQI